MFLNEILNLLIKNEKPLFKLYFRFASDISHRTLVGNSGY